MGSVGSGRELVVEALNQAFRSGSTGLGKNEYIVEPVGSAVALPRDRGIRLHAMWAVPRREFVAEHSPKALCDVCAQDTAGFRSVFDLTVLPAAATPGRLFWDATMFHSRNSLRRLRSIRSIVLTPGHRDFQLAGRPRARLAPAAPGTANPRRASAGPRPRQRRRQPARPHLPTSLSMARISSSPIRSALSAPNRPRGRLRYLDLPREEDRPCSATPPKPYAHRDRYQTTGKTSRPLR